MEDLLGTSVASIVPREAAEMLDLMVGTFKAHKATHGSLESVLRTAGQAPIMTQPLLLEHRHWMTCHVSVVGDDVVVHFRTRLEFPGAAVLSEEMAVGAKSGFVQRETMRGTMEKTRVLIPGVHVWIQEPQIQFQTILEEKKGYLCEVLRIDPKHPNELVYSIAYDSNQMPSDYINNPAFSSSTRSDCVTTASILFRRTEVGSK